MPPDSPTGVLVYKLSAPPNIQFTSRHCQEVKTETKVSGPAVTGRPSPAPCGLLGYYLLAQTPDPGGASLPPASPLVPDPQPGLTLHLPHGVRVCGETGVTEDNRTANI